MAAYFHDWGVLDSKMRESNEETWNRTRLPERVKHRAERVERGGR